ncbi:hypothetical protein BDV93DRAFT_226285 [Ceratobasidium sp. AG-I]|nr:hypothetical protein BDV93DRAFT_226285 [Ceratobasidium sp. AG-I]
MAILAEKVPLLRSVHVGKGILFMVGRDSLGNFKSEGGIGYLSNADSGPIAVGYSQVWKTRPRSKNAEEIFKRAMYADTYAHIYEPQPHPDLDLDSDL